MINRRRLLQSSALVAGGLMFAPWLQAATDGQVTKAPKRFIFLHKGNGLLPNTLMLPSITAEQKEQEKRRDSYSVDLNKHDLPEWMSPLSAHKKDMAIVQGLSGKMCQTGHHTWCSSLGVYKATERLSSIKWATVDVELARMFPAAVEHIELACFPEGGGNSRGNINGIDKGFSALGPQRPNFAFGSPKIAMEELYKSVSQDKQAQIQCELERTLLEFTANSQAKLSNGLETGEKAKVQGYSDSISEMRAQNKRIEGMSQVIRKYIPKLEKKHFEEDINTIDRQWGHTEILLSLLVSGMTNVVTFTLDELGTIYTGLPGLEGERVNLHDVGHGKSFGGIEALAIREKVRHQHMKVIDHIVKRLKSVPEEGGTMFDNTMILYFPDNGETHHSNGVEWPFIMLSGSNAKLNIRGQYIRLPKHGDEGHKTLGNWYTTILNAYGNDIPHFGDPDVALDALKRDQKGPIKQFTV